MATPSLTNGGLWSDEITASTSQTFTLKIGVWTKITNPTDYTPTFSFTGTIVRLGSFKGISSYQQGGGSTYVLRIA